MEGGRRRAPADQLEPFDTNELVKAIELGAREFRADARALHGALAGLNSHAKHGAQDRSFGRLRSGSPQRAAPSPGDVVIHASADRFSAAREEEMKFFPEAPAKHSPTS